MRNRTETQRSGRRLQTRPPASTAVTSTFYATCIKRAVLLLLMLLPPLLLLPSRALRGAR